MCSTLKPHISECDASACAACQFWYTEDTARTVARAVVQAAGAGGAFACVACPSLFRALRTFFPDVRAQLLEYDTRFQALGCFSAYDYREPRAVLPELHGAFDVVVADPPYLVRASASHPEAGSLALSATLKFHCSMNGNATQQQLLCTERATKQQNSCCKPGLFEPCSSRLPQPHER